MKGQKVTTLSLRGEMDFLEGVTAVSQWVMARILEHFTPREGFGRNISNLTLGIVGMGRIGQHVMSRARSFNMNVVSASLGDDAKKFDGLFKRADIVSIHIPETPKNINFVGSYFLDLMKPESIIINSSRPSVLDEEYLKVKIEKKEIAGAILDVTDLKWDMPNVTITDHVAGSLTDDRKLSFQFMANKLMAEMTKPDSSR
jgi:phosphoglycerate dehydrogenase-like enzyme